MCPQLVHGKLFSKLISSFVNCRWQWSLGIQHVVERPHLVQLLRSWEAADDATKEEAEQRVLEAFYGNVKLIPLPPALRGEERERLVEIVGKWNSSHSTKCEFLLFRLLAICRSRKNNCWLSCCAIVQKRGGASCISQTHMVFCCIHD